MLDHLFGSRTRVKLLRLFYREPQRHFFVRELTRLADTQINAVRRELTHLTNSGIIAAVDAPENLTGEAEDAHEAKRKYYRLNEASPLYPELRALLLKSHVLGEDSLRNQIVGLGDIKLLLFTGSFTNANTSVDMLIVGTVPAHELTKIMNEFEHDHGIAVRYAIMPLREFEERRQLMDRFIYEVLDSRHEKAINTIL